MAKKKGPKQVDPATVLAEEILALEAVATAAGTKGQHAAAVTARSRITSLRMDLARIQSEAVIAALPDPLERLRATYRLFVQQGAMTVAVQLGDQLAKAEAEAAKVGQPAALSEEEALAAVEAALPDLSDVHLVRLLRGLCARLGLPYPGPATPAGLAS